MHTAIDCFRVDENRTVNHHGRIRKVGEKQDSVDTVIVDNFVAPRDYDLVQR